MTPEDLFFKLSRLHRSLIVVAICVLLLVGFYFLFISEIRDEIGTLEQQIAKLKIEIENEKKILQEGPKLKAKIENLKERLQQMVASLPEKQDIEALLKRITDLLAESNLMATRFVPGQEQVNTELYYASIPISLNTTGDYFKQGSFLASLNSLPRIVNVPSVRLSPTGTTGREGEIARKFEVIQLMADISGVTYRRLSPEEIKSITDQHRPGAPGRPGRK
ncbi:MAG: type 4a pilus biogenesis protein PilO [Deltaproteobacteria bacterium]|nr:type 4a pilus biogenesis protein PilO [Deltaproteobacteria bacterium]